MRRIDDPSFVRVQYETEANLAARKSVYANAEGPDARDVAFQAVMEVRPTRVLEVGGGEGELAERIVGEDVELVAVDQSARMVEIQRSKGIDARVGDVRQLPFAAAFDTTLAAWMLYHVADVDQALAELARVLEPGGRLIAVTNGYEHLAELWDLVGRDRVYRRELFSSETAEEMLEPHFARVDRRDVHGRLLFDDVAVRRYVSSWPELGDPNAVPSLVEPLQVRRASTVFVATKAN